MLCCWCSKDKDVHPQHAPLAKFKSQPHAYSLNEDKLKAALEGDLGGTCEYVDASVASDFSQVHIPNFGK